MPTYSQGSFMPQMSAVMWARTDCSITGMLFKFQPLSRYSCRQRSKARGSATAAAHFQLRLFKTTVKSLLRNKNAGWEGEAPLLTLGRHRRPWHVTQTTPTARAGVPPAPNVTAEEYRQHECFCIKLKKNGT